MVARVGMAPVTDAAANLDLLVALTRGGGAADAPALLRHRVDGPSLLAFARRHQVSGYLYARLAETPMRELVDAGSLQELGRRRDLQLKKIARLEAELARVAQRLTAASLEAILLKGPHLAERFYGDPDARAYWDLDLLVRPQDRAAADRALIEAGFERVSRAFPSERVAAAVTHAFDYRRDDVGVDLHWKLASHPSIRVIQDRLWRRRQSFELRAGRFSVLSDDYLLTLLLLSCFKDLERGALRLRSFVDLWKVLAAMAEGMDWVTFFAERREENVTSICVSMLDVFLEAFSAAEQFPALAAALQPSRRDSWSHERERVTDLLGSGGWVLSRRLWAMRRYDMPAWRHGLWWAYTLPVRMAVHDPVRFGRRGVAVRPRPRGSS